METVKAAMLLRMLTGLIFFYFSFYFCPKIDKMQQYTENELVERLRDRATVREAFAQVVSLYGEKLYWHIRRMVMSHEDANDLLQNTFIKAWLNVEFFRGDAKLSTWLYRIAINECITFLNRQRTANCLSVDDVDVFLLEKLKGDDYFDGDELQLNLQKAVLALPDKQRLVFNMKYFDDMKYEEMSEALGTSVGALKASYHHAVKKISDFLTKDA
jgi:RNA polymerase sigma-70 factor (ECF subfamily)